MDLNGITMQCKWNFITLLFVAIRKKEAVVFENILILYTVFKVFFFNFPSASFLEIAFSYIFSRPSFSATLSTKGDWTANIALDGSDRW